MWKHVIIIKRRAFAGQVNVSWNEQTGATDFLLVTSGLSGASSAGILKRSLLIGFVSAVPIGHDDRF